MLKALCVFVPATLLAPSCFAQFTIDAQVTTGLSLVGGAYDPGSDEVLLYESFGSVIRRFSRAGAPLGTLARPGESANDADLEVTSVALTLGSSPVPAGTLLMINGESGVAEIYALNAAGQVIATLVTAFGVSHVVGGAYHPTRATFFLVQDRVPGGAAANTIAEVNAQTGAVLNSFRVTDARPTFTVNFGDMEVGPNGNLFVVSSDEASILELTPEGAFVAEHALPAQVPDLCGIGVDSGRCEFWVMGTNGVVVRLRTGEARVCEAPGCNADYNMDGGADTADVLDLANDIAAGTESFPPNTPDFNRDGGADTADVLDIANVIAGGACP